MKIINTQNKKVYDIELQKQGENPMPCPECKDTRKHKKSKSFSFNSQTGVGYCHNCESKFAEYKPFKTENKYYVPEWKNTTDLSDKVVKYFNGRGISQQTLNKMRVYTEQYSFGAEPETAICFPYFRNESLVNVKYRNNKKDFRLIKDAEKIFWNFDALLSNNEIIIVEGEIDLLSCVEAGMDNVVSVPNGAKSTDFIDDCIDTLEGINKFIIAVDQDYDGMKLRDELIRRLGDEKCFIADLEDCKDANEYLTKHSGFDLHERIKAAKEIPVSGIIDLNDCYKEAYNLYLNGLAPGLTIGELEVDQYITWETKRLVCVSGIPSHGKSEWVDFQAVKLNLLHGWKVGYFSPENFPIEYHITKLISKITGKQCNPDSITGSEFEAAYKYIQNNFFFIYPDDDFTIETILQKAKILVKRHGIKQFVVDPYNKLEHKLRQGESKTDYVSRLLDELITFGKKNDCLIYLVAHPTKMKKRDNGLYEVPTLYDIADSANFYNKPDYGIVIYKDKAKGMVEVYICKVKFKHLGKEGIARFYYNWKSGRFETTPDNWSEFNWLDGKPVNDMHTNTLFSAPLEPRKLNPDHEEEFDYTKIDGEPAF